MLIADGHGLVSPHGYAEPFGADLQLVPRVQ
jgi:hypothetical protein